jgi:small conductance mechanosensitive channel
MSFDFSEAWKSGARIIDEAISLLPNLVLAALIFLVFLLFAALARSLATRSIRNRKKHQGLALLAARLIGTGVIVLGFLIALSVVAPSFKAGDLIRLLGVGSVAIGFAFQNILQNFLAGILLLLQEPFQLGDLISVTGIEGNVRDIQARATVVSTKEGRHVWIPNAILFTSPVAVETAGPGQPKPDAAPRRKETAHARERSAG